MFKKLSVLASVLAAGLFCTFLFAQDNEAGTDVKDVRILMKTSKGDIKIQVYASQTPVTAASFLNLAKRGYYNDVTFHRVVPNFVIQAGDTTGTGMGTPGYAFADEIVKGLKHDKAGILSMANTGRPMTNGSQFFITHRATPHLDNKHTVFGQVIEGQDVVDKIAQGDKILKIEFIDSPDAIFKAEKEKIDAWNKILDANKNKSVLPNAKMY